MAEATMADCETTCEAPPCPKANAPVVMPAVPSTKAAATAIVFHRIRVTLLGPQYPFALVPSIFAVSSVPHQ